jgi:hypothetical protein
MDSGGAMIDLINVSDAEKLIGAFSLNPLWQSSGYIFRPLIEVGQRSWPVDIIGPKVTNSTVVMSEISFDYIPVGYRDYSTAALSATATAR